MIIFPPSMFRNRTYSSSLRSGNLWIDVPFISLLAICIIGMSTAMILLFCQVLTENDIFMLYALIFMSGSLVCLPFMIIIIFVEAFFGEGV